MGWDRCGLVPIHAPTPPQAIRAAAATTITAAQIRLVPLDEGLDIYLVGNLAAMLGLGTKKRPGSDKAEAQLTLVAGARNHRELTLCVEI